MSMGGVLDFINQCERSLPVQDWRVSDIHLWPMIRMRLYGSAFATAQSRDPVRRARMRLIVRGLSLQASHFRDRAQEAARTNRADVLIVSDGVVTVPVGAARFEVIADSLSELVTDAGLKPLVWINSHAAAMPRFGKSARIETAVAVAQLAGLARALVYSPSVRLDNYDALLEAATQGQLPVQSMSAARVRAAAARLLALVSFFTRQLHCVQPRLVLVNCYYTLANMALIVAARRLKIPCVDVQHGVQGASHVAYGRWATVPTGGWNVLPDFFWCWSEVEAGHIRAWSAPSGGAHAAIVGGNVWMNVWQSARHPLMRAAEEEVVRLGARNPGTTKVLVTLQWGLADEKFLAPLIRVIRTADSRFAWWIRLHPSMEDRRAEIAGLLAGIDRAAEALPVASGAPLLALLRHADVHLTYNSSSVLEADELGVASVVGSDSGAALFPELVAAGRILIATPMNDSFLDAVVEAARRRVEPRAVSAEVARGALLQLIGSSAGRG